MKFRQTINVKKFISILLCTIFISSILPSNLLSCTVLADNSQHSENKYQGKDVEYEYGSHGFEFLKLVNETDDTHPLEKNRDYSVSSVTNNNNEAIWKVTIKKNYLDNLNKGKNYAFRIHYNVIDNGEIVEEDKPVETPYIINVPGEKIYPPVIPAQKENNIHTKININTKNKNLYLNNSDENGVKTILLIGTPGHTIKIINKNGDQEIGKGTVSANGECKISLDDKFKELQNGKAYPLSIYQEKEENSLKKQSNSLDVTLNIHNTAPTITLKLNGKEEKNPVVSKYTLDTLTATATDQANTNLSITYLVSTKKYNTLEEASNAKGWCDYEEAIPIALEQNQYYQSVFVYVKATDIANCSAIDFFILRQIDTP